MCIAKPVPCTWVCRLCSDLFLQVQDDDPFAGDDWGNLSDSELETPEGGWDHISTKAAALMVLRARRAAESVPGFTSVLHKVQNMILLLTFSL
jgi:hypothetical protein